MPAAGAAVRLPTTRDLQFAVTLLAKTTSRDAYGAEVITWTPYATNVAAAVAESAVQDQVVGEQRHAHRMTEVTIRYRSDVVAGQALTWGSLTLSIRGVLTIGRRQFSVLRCEDFNG